MDLWKYEVGDIVCCKNERSLNAVALYGASPPFAGPINERYLSMFGRPRYRTENGKTFSEEFLVLLRRRGETKPVGLLECLRSHL